MKISLIGPPGAGKGTFASKISEKYGIPVIAIGRELRRMAEKTELGRILKEKYWGRGKLVPTKYAMEILKEKINKKGYILDGFPRELNEAKKFDKIDQLDAVILLKVKKSTLMFRLTGRLQCRRCGRVYHIKNYPPKKPGICDICKIKLYKRSDDQERKTIRERLKIFNEEIKPIVKYYKSKGILKEINGEDPISIIIRNIENAVKELKKKKLKENC